MRFVRLFDDLTELTENEDSKVQFDPRRAFKTKSDLYAKQWNAFAQLHGMLQENGLARNKGQKMIDTLHKTIDVYREKQGHPFKDCELKNNHSKLGNKHETDHAFSRGVDKIQNKKEKELTNSEKNACKNLLKRNHLNWAAVDTQEEDDDDLSEEELFTQESSTFSMKSIYSHESKKAEAEERKSVSEYIDCSFIGSSAAIVESLWSKFDALVDQRRSGMSPVMIEAILYLKENRDLWDINDVRTALKKLKENEKTARFEARLAAFNQDEDQIMADMETLNPTNNNDE
jgi:hypothetical protein